jgi:TonB-dependent starch-binding outer membrane protein SusC
MRNQRLLLFLTRHGLSFSFFFFIYLSIAAQKQVTGVVKESNIPIVGATIEVKGTNVATITGFDGKFVITLPEGKNILVISYVGLETQTINVGDKTQLEIAMLQRNTTLNEVVVTGYSSQAKKDITGSVSVVNTGDLKSVPAANAETQLQGRASGVTVITANRPGDGASVRIRGFSSFTGNEPLIIIDGVPGSLGTINPNDIESMQVLKDAASASIYGARASNGVIIVTTKKGRQGAAKVSYNMYYGRAVPVDGFTNLLNPTEMMNLALLAKTNDGAVLQHDQYSPTGGTWRLPDYILAGNASGIMEGDPAADPSKYNLNIDNVSGSYLIVRANKAGTNWFDAITDNAPIMNHNISIAGGAERNRYMFSFDYLDQKGIVRNNFFKRYTGRVNTEFSVKKNIRIGENLQISYAQGNGAGLNDEGTEIANTYRAQPIVPLFNINGDFAGSRGANLGNGNSPYATRERSVDNRNHGYTFFGNGYAEVDFLKHLTARTSFGGAMYNNNYYNYTFQTYENSENNSGSSYTEGANYFRSWTWTNQLTYKNTFQQKHDLTALVGTEAVEEWGRFLQGTRLGLFVDAVDFRALNGGSRTDGSPYTPSALFSLFGKVDYVFNNKYLASVIVRRDGSSRFGPEKRYGVFPGGSIGWRVSEEDFMQSVGWISDLKIRGSYGQMGNQRIDPANAISQFRGGVGSSNYDINGTQNGTVTGFQLSFVGNPEGQWETNRTIDVGFDATLFGGKTELIFDWYNKKTEDLLYQLADVATAGAAAGVNPAYFNVAQMRNTGIDVLLTQKGNLGTSGLKFDATIAFTTYKNEIEQIAPGIEFFETDNGERNRIGGAFVRNAVGHPMSSYFGYKVVGLFQDATDVASSPTQNAAAPGRFKYLDADGDGAITDDDRVFFGSPIPDFTYGLNLNLSFKNFDLSTFFYGAAGKDAINYVKWWTDFVPSFQGAKSKAALYDSWTTGKTDATVPIQEESGNFSTNGAINSYYMENASYFRMKNLSIGYSLPGSVLNRFKIDRLRIYVQATNLFTITDYSGLDPEIIGGDQGFGIDAGVYPTVRQFYVGVNLNF